VLKKLREGMLPLLQVAGQRRLLKPLSGKNQKWEEMILVLVVAGRNISSATGVEKRRVKNEE
jgi:hypothetical protein